MLTLAPSFPLSSGGKGTPCLPSFIKRLFALSRPRDERPGFDSVNRNRLMFFSFLFYRTPKIPRLKKQQKNGGFLSSFTTLFTFGRRTKKKHHRNFGRLLFVAIRPLHPRNRSSFSFLFFWNFSSNFHSRPIPAVDNGAHNGVDFRLPSQEETPQRQQRQQQQQQQPKKQEKFQRKRIRHNWAPSRRVLFEFFSDCPQDHRVFPSFHRFYLVLPSFTEFDSIWAGLKRVLPSFTRFQWILPSFTEF